MKEQDIIEACVLIKTILGNTVDLKVLDFMEKSAIEKLKSESFADDTLAKLKELWKL